MKKILSDLNKNYPELRTSEKSIETAFCILKECLEKNGTIFICGNGGSASDSEHIVSELMKSFRISRPIGEKIKEKLISKYRSEGRFIAKNLQSGLKAISLTGHFSFSTAYGNDVNSEMIFAQQVHVLGGKGDVLIGISTSGSAANIINALKVASVMGMRTVLLTGSNGGECSKVAECSIRAPASETYRIQEYHLPIYHALCAMLEEHFYGRNRRRK